MNILIVDDSQDAADGLRELLANLGFASSVSYGGRDGLAQILEGKVDIVLLDIEMPEMNGLEVACATRKWLSPSPILVALTGWNHPEAGHEICKAGFDYYLRKPLNLNLLVNLLEAVCARSLPTAKPG
jgi:two-component system, sensor histidine kinase